MPKKKHTVEGCVVVDTNSTDQPLWWNAAAVTFHKDDDMFTVFTSEQKARACVTRNKDKSLDLKVLGGTLREGT